MGNYGLTRGSENRWSPFLWTSPGPRTVLNGDYYDRAVKANGAGSIRFFAAPGVNHCGGGPGADSFDPLAALERWVEQDEAPETMVATNRTSGIERPVCAWPKLPYCRSGDPSKADSFVCR